MLHVFGYGSLTFSPELPELLLSLRRGRVQGLRRAFNKRSRSRSAPAGACWDVGGAPDGWTVGGRRVSITLGTAPGDFLEGLVASYPRSTAAELLPRLDAREGFDPADPDPGYRPRDVDVHVDGEVVVARTYLTNPGATWTLDPPPDPDATARILIRSTPIEPVGGPRAPGLEYLEGTRRSLREVGITDAYLESVAAAVRALPGPWTQRVAPVR